jgi:hypothetical protein
MDDCSILRTVAWLLSGLVLILSNDHVTFIIFTTVAVVFLGGA